MLTKGEGRSDDESDLILVKYFNVKVDLLDAVCFESKSLKYFEVLSVIFW